MNRETLKKENQTNIGDKIKEIYKRRQQAHEDLLVCDMELDGILQSLDKARESEPPQNQ